MNHFLLFISANQVPNLLIDFTTVNVTVGVEASFLVTVNDTEDDPFTFDNTLPEGSTFTVDSENDKLGTFTWTPSDDSLVEGLT